LAEHLTLTTLTINENYNFPNYKTSPFHPIIFFPNIMSRRSKTTSKKKTIKKEVPKKFKQEAEGQKPVDSYLSVATSLEDKEGLMASSTKVTTATKTQSGKKAKEASSCVAAIASNRKKREVVKDEEGEDNEPNLAKDKDEEQAHSRGRLPRRVATKKAKYTEVDSTTDEESANEEVEDDDDFEHNSINKSKKTGHKKTKTRSIPARSKEDTTSCKNEKKVNKPPLQNIKEQISDVWKPSQGDWRSLAGIDY
jgi:hypothetical protein